MNLIYRAYRKYRAESQSIFDLLFSCSSVVLVQTKVFSWLRYDWQKKKFLLCLTKIDSFSHMQFWENLNGKWVFCLITESVHLYSKRELIIVILRAIKMSIFTLYEFVGKHFIRSEKFKFPSFINVYKFMVVSLHCVHLTFDICYTFH